MELPFRVAAAPGTTDADGALPEPESGCGGCSEPMPLSPAQTGQWLAQQLDPAVPMSVAQYVDIGEGRADSTSTSSRGPVLERPASSVRV